MNTPVAIIKKRGKKYHLVSHKGKTLGVHSTREGALKQEQAIEIAKHARQLADGIGRFLAEQDRDDHGRFSGPGGGDASNVAHEATKQAEKSGSERDHGTAAGEHHRAAAVHYKEAAKGGPSAPSHLQAGDAHKRKASEHATIAREKGIAEGQRRLEGTTIDVHHKSGGVWQTTKIPGGSLREHLTKLEQEGASGIKVGGKSPGRKRK